MLERSMNLLELIKYRRSIRKYTEEPISRECLEQIIEAGIHAPNAGGGQRSMVVGIRDARLVEKIGRLNVACMDRSRLAGRFVSAEQPSIIDDPSIMSGFYGAPCVAVIFSQKNFYYAVPDAYCIATNMVLMATELGLGSCIVARGEQTFDNAEGERLLSEWNIPEDMVARCFVTLGYPLGEYPKPKPRKDSRTLIID
ncbi:MAG: nitroreductase family protein [Bacteroidaceae bacterium]|nr:nitroreductase family protein [Bacteroidaceae bacterium]